MENYFLTHDVSSWEREKFTARQFNWGGCLLNSNGGEHMI